MPPFIKKIELSPNGIEVVFHGGHRFAYHYEEPSKRPSLPPPTFVTTAEPVSPSGPGLARAIPRTNVVPLRRKVG